MRYISALWGNVKNKGLSESEVESLVTEIVNTEVEEINTEITNIINLTLPAAIKTASGNNHESFLIENTTETEVTVASSWTVEKYNEQVGEFKAVVMVRDKSLNEIKTLMNILSFDYADAIKVVNENSMLIDASITLFCGIEAGTNKLFATLTGMTNNAKRIHLCFERCVLSERFWDIDSEMSMILETTAYLQAYLNMQATADMALNFEVGLSGYSNLQAQLPMVLDSTAILTAYGRIQANMNMELEGQAVLTAYKQLIADSLPMSMNVQAGLAAYASLSIVSLPMSFVLQAQLANVPLNMTAPMAMQLTVSGTVTNAVETVVIGGITYNVQTIGALKVIEGFLKNTDGGAGIYSPDGNDANVNEYGRLYSWDAMIRLTSILPSGWRFITSADKTAMSNSFGGDTASGGHFKEAGAVHWIGSNADNSSKLSWRGAGFRYNSSNYYLRSECRIMLSESLVGSTFSGTGAVTSGWNLAPVTSTYGRYNSYLSLIACKTV